MIRLLLVIIFLFIATLLKLSYLMTHLSLQGELILYDLALNALLIALAAMALLREPPPTGEEK